MQLCGGVPPPPRSAFVSLPSWVWEARPCPARAGLPRVRSWLPQVGVRGPQEAAGVDCSQRAWQKLAPRRQLPAKPRGLMGIHSAIGMSGPGSRRTVGAGSRSGLARATGVQGKVSGLSNCPYDLPPPQSSVRDIRGYRQGGADAHPGPARAQCCLPGLQVTRQWVLPAHQEPRKASSWTGQQGRVPLGGWQG
jgi:hypothetical protein